MRAEIANTILEISATFLRVPSMVFLLPYSPELLIHPSPSHNHPFGDINNTDQISSVPVIIIIIVSAIRIFYNINKITHL